MSFIKNILQEIIRKEYESIKEPIEQNTTLPTVTKQMTYEQETYFMEILQRGDINEICQAAQTIFKNSNSFWSIAAREDGFPLEHSGLPDTITKTLKNIIAELYSEIKFSEKFETEKEIWEKIAKDQDFTMLLMDAIVDTMYLGDVTFYARYIDNKMLIKYEKGRNIEYVYDEFNQLKEIIFLKKLAKDNKDYLLKTFIGADALYIKYALYDKEGKEVPLFTLDETSNLENIEVLKDGKYIDCSFATQFYINKSLKYEGRGASLFTNKLYALDALDEVISQRQSTLRSGSPKEFIDETCITKNNNNQENIQKTSMHKFFKKSNTNIEGASKDIEVIQSDIRSEEYRIQEEDAKRRVYEGILSEQTLSNTSTINNTAINKQREKLTNYTVDTIKKACQNILPKFVYNVINIYCIYNNMKTEITPDDILADFAEYNNPTFETQVEVCSQIKKNKLLPNFEMLQELYQETKTDEEIAEIARRLDIMDGYDFDKVETEEAIEDDDKAENIENDLDDEEESLENNTNLKDNYNL